MSAELINGILTGRYDQWTFRQHLRDINDARTLNMLLTQGLEQWKNDIIRERINELGGSGHRAGINHMIQHGDTLFDLALRYYGDGYQWIRIYNANGGINPYTLQPGTIIYIP